MVGPPELTMEETFVVTYISTLAFGVGLGFLVSWFLKGE